MKIEIRETKAKGIIQITTADERWYHNQDLNIFRPSSSWICSYYPKGIEYYKWLAKNGWNEAEAIKEAAGNKGSKVHQAIDLLTNGKTVNLDDQFMNTRTEMPEPLTVEEWECIMSFKEWFDAEKPKRIISQEQTVENSTDDYAGTQDLKYEKQNGKICIADYKTSAYVWDYMRGQLSSYKHADGNEDVDEMEIIQLNYKQNKLKKYKVTPVEDEYDNFLAAKRFWYADNKDVHPKQKDYPLSLTLNLNDKGQPQFATEETMGEAESA